MESDSAARGIRVAIDVSISPRPLVHYLGWAAKVANSEVVLLQIVSATLVPVN